MRASCKTSVLQDLDHLFRSGIAASGDGALVHRFLADGNETAFEALVSRHGPMVRGVCRRLLVNPHDVDDAFQATFLVLVRKARQLRDPNRIGPWLYGVAKRVATRARSRSIRHRHEPLVEAWSDEEHKTEWLDVMPILDDELGRLSAKHRDVLILCLLSGASPEEAAGQLGCPVGTVKSRLARGREALRGRLTSRGIAPAVALAALSSTDAFASPVSPALARATMNLVAGPATSSVFLTLTKGALPSMLPKSIVVSSLLLGGIVAAGIGATTWLKATSAQEALIGIGSPSRAPAAGGAQELQTSNNMKQILLAFHNYYALNGTFPAVSNYGPDGQPKLSWRVAILPFLSENDLFSRFRQDEPWDSPHNKVLIDQMPSVFQAPGSPPVPAGHTRIRGFVGKGAMFEGTRGVDLAEVTDGTSNTAIIAVAREAVPWTQPAEIPFAADEPLAALDVNNPRGYTLGMADGSIHRLAATENRLLRQIITRAGGEVIVWPSSSGTEIAQRGREVSPSATPPVYAPTAPQPTPAPAPANANVIGSGSIHPIAPHPQALEQRMQRLEEKFDRLLEKLDRLFSEGRPAGPSR